MKPQRTVLPSLFVLCVSLACVSHAHAQSSADTYQPRVGQPGKDVVWVPNPEEMVEKMLDLAAVTPHDFVVDLGSGDGRNVIAAAKRGARALGVEYNPDLVEYSKQNAAKAGVADKAMFVQGDMYEADISRATVMALFLLPDNLKKLRSKLLDLTPGTRIVANTFGIEGWTPDDTKTFEDDCSSWCTIMLWIVPAKVAGTWTLPQGGLTLAQDFQMITGTLGAMPVSEGRMRGYEISFTAAGAHYTGRVSGNRIQGTVKTADGERTWSASRVEAPR